VFTLSGLPAGNYTLRAMHEGSQPVYYSGGANWSDATPVMVTSGESTANIDFQLPDETGEDPDLLTLRQSTTMPEMYDPGWTDFAHNGYLVDQIFAGMTRIAPEDGSTIKNLVSSWAVKENTDSTEEWTFTLRNDLKWSDGSPLTAADLRYGLLRDLKMDKDANIVYNMMVIQGAEAYNQGTVGADQVGVTLDEADPEHVIHFTLITPTAFFPTLMSTMPVRPIPQMLAQAFPDTWLEPNKLITSGPYRLIEIDANHVLLKKNANFIDQANVQIQQVVIQSVPKDEVYGKYLSGELDTATIPGAAMNAANTDPDVKAALNLVPQQCTTYAGFNIQTLPVGDQPVDEVLLRKALIEAIDRNAFVAAMGGGISTAWTFIPPGVIGHSDPSAGIHLDYDPDQALADINAAYGGNYTGLPEITIYYSNDISNADVQRAEMEYLANAWNQLLNTHFVVAGIPASEYTNRIATNQMFTYFRGWCSDYNDGYNFLSFLSSSPMFGGWQNSTFNQLLNDALSQPDEIQRAAIYQQAEEIALKTDAILVPLYYNVSPILSRGFVRSFGVGGSDYIADWTLDRTDEQVIGAQVTSLSAQAEDTLFTPAGEGGAVAYTIPEGAFPAGTTLTHTGKLTYNLTNLPDGKSKTSLYFTLQTEGAGNTPVAAAADYTLTVHYAQAEVDTSHLMENSLALYYWDNAAGQWVKDSNSQVNPTTNTITTHSQHLGDWLVMGTEGTNHVFIPLVVR
ncbi:MAG: ABC transporter substrate-binding protein, partial [Anaerolineaceae bacterium]